MEKYWHLENNFIFKKKLKYHMAQWVASQSGETHRGWQNGAAVSRHKQQLMLMLMSPSQAQALGSFCTKRSNTNNWTRQRKKYTVNLASKPNASVFLTVWPATPDMFRLTSVCKWRQRYVQLQSKSFTNCCPQNILTENICFNRFVLVALDLSLKHDVSSAHAHFRRL